MPSDYFRLIHQHDRYPFPYRVAKLARVAGKARFIGFKIEFSLALRADENGNQFG
jgi:hypothetical protein